jgi:hypothetical protein
MNIKEVPPMNGWLRSSHKSDRVLALGGHFCVLIVSLRPIAYPTLKQVKPKLNTAKSTSMVIMA